MENAGQNTLSIDANNAITRLEGRQYSSQIQSLIQRAKANQMEYAARYRKREIQMGFLGLLIVLIGSSGFGYFFFMEADIAKALACIVLTFFIPPLLNLKTQSFAKTYIKDYKENFMPQMAHALGGFKFDAGRGISQKIISKTGVLPPYQSYHAEDCFSGVYKGVKVMFSEAKLFGKSKTRPIFNGLFVFMEVGTEVFEGHTIITSDQKLTAQYAATKWKSLSNIPSSHPNFQVFSSNPENASMIAGEKLLKELAEAGEVFNNAPLSAAFFKGKYIFIAIPNEVDMFEAPDIYDPVMTPGESETCKKEIDQILEIVDVVEIYKK